MKKPAPTEEPARRGPHLKGDKPRIRYNFTLNPDIVAAGRKLAKQKGESLSQIVERGISLQLG